MGILGIVLLALTAILLLDGIGKCPRFGLLFGVALVALGVASYSVVGVPGLAATPVAGMMGTVYWFAYSTHATSEDDPVRWVFPTETGIIILAAIVATTWVIGWGVAYGGVFEHQLAATFLMVPVLFLAVWGPGGSVQDAEDDVAGGSAG